MTTVLFYMMIHDALDFPFYSDLGTHKLLSHMFNQLPTEQWMSLLELVD